MSVTTVPLLEDLQGIWKDLRVEYVGPEGVREPEPLPDIYPFLSVNDLKRHIWIQRGGDPRWAPEHVFLGVRSGAGFRPVEFHWPASVLGRAVDLPDPLPAEARKPSPALLDEGGNRKPVGPIMMGSLILETALSPEILSTGSLPVLTAISLAVLMPATPESLSTALLEGFYQLYFPWITAPAQVLDAANPSATTNLRDMYTAALPYTEDRTGRIQVVQQALGRRTGGASATMTNMVRLRWVLPPPSTKPESLEKTFYGLQASPTIPLLRYFPATGTTGKTLLKLALRNDGSLVMDSPKILTSWLSQVAPTSRSAVILARVPLVSAHVEAGTAFTVYMFEDGTSDLTLEVPQRGMTFIAAVATEAQRVLRDVVRAMGFPVETEPMLRDIHASYQWTHPNPTQSTALSAKRIQQRVAALTPFLELVPAMREVDEQALAVFQWRAVSNYESESAQFAFITQMVLRGGGLEEGGAAVLAAYATELGKRFGLTQQAAAAVIERWIERRQEAVAPVAGPAGGALAVPKSSTGSFIAVTGRHPEYTIEIQNADSYSELQRILSVLGVLLGATTADLLPPPPAGSMDAIAAVVAVAEAATEAAAEAAGPADSNVDAAEMDPELAAMLAGIGFGTEAAPEEDEAPLAAPKLVVEEVVAGPSPGAAAPDVEAAVADVEQECGGVRWQPGEPAMKIPGDYWMALLRKGDTKMFGYKGTGRSSGYSKSCQRRDGRQPNIFTLAEYARIKRCYGNQVRFVDLPPRRASDLPVIPDYNPRRPVSQYPDDFFQRDPQTGKPMWIVYGYENKTVPGTWSYLMCAELWCVRDNLPLIREEYDSTQGRGFAKAAQSCPWCGGRAITDTEAPRSSESVIVRQPKEATNKLHSYIGVITRKKFPHPEGYQLPCCDTTPRLLKKYLEANFRGTLVFGKELAVEDEEGGAAAVIVEEEEEAAEPAPELELVAEGEGIVMDYDARLKSMRTQYILGGDKALSAGKLGLLPPLLDEFFGQNGQRALESRGIRPTLVENAHAFLRLGVDTRIRSRGLNLFAALAPLLGFQSAEQTQRFFVSQRMVRAFESANYGTLVAEFAARSTVTEDELASSLTGFAAEFGYQLSTNRPHIIRLYKAWIAFLNYLADPKQPKQLRHIEHLMAQPGVIVPRGLLLVVLEQMGDEIRVVCPSFGIPPASLFGDVPVSFVVHETRDDSWEPLVLYNGTKEAVKFFGERSADLEALPKPLRISLQRWLREWRSSSLGCGRPAPPPHVWTPEKDTTDLPRLSQLRTKLKSAVPSALVRDRSNRLAGVLFAIQGVVGSIFVPCLDDGNLADQLPRVFEVDAITAASLDATLRFYADLQTQFPPLEPVKLLAKMEDATQIVGILTRAGTMVPIASSSVAAAAPLPVQQLDAFPWERDALILRAPNAPALETISMEESLASVEEQLQEAYQHLRLSVSRWLTRDARAPTVRADLAKLLASSLPLYERRKRMDILLEPLVREMILSEETTERKTLSLLREDCLSLPEAECAEQAACRWSGGRCLIHAPTRTAGTDPVRIFTARLSDEILRYSAKKNEIFTDAVPSIRTPRGAVRVGTELYMGILPKESAAAVLERLGFTGRVAEAFPEEMLRFAGLEEEPSVMAAQGSAEAEALGAPVATETLPASWLEKGLSVPSPAPGLENARGLAFASGSGRSLEEWEDFIKIRRAKMALPGDPTRPFQWSVQDLYVLAALTSSNQVFVVQEPTGQLRVERWIAPPATGTKVAQPLYMIFWGSRQLLVAKGKNYRFFARDLPADLLALLDTASPMEEAEARGSVEVPIANGMP